VTIEAEHSGVCMPVSTEAYPAGANAELAQIYPLYFLLNLLEFPMQLSI